MNMLPKWMIVALVALILVMTAGGVSLYKVQERNLREDAEANLLAVSQLKAEEISNWRAERLADGAILVDSPFFLRGARRFFDTKEPEAERELRLRLETILRNNHYRNILVIDPEGRIQISLKNEHKAILHTEDLEALAEARQRRKPVLSELHAAEQSDVALISVVVPLFQKVAEADREIGHILLVSDIRGSLDAVLKVWPTVSASAETLLVRQDGDSVLFMSDLRFSPGMAMKRRVPLERTEVPAVMAIKGYKGVVEGIDYRGVKVFGALSAIPHSSWHLVAKIDKDEVLSTWHFISILIIGLMLALLFVVIASIALLWQHGANRHYRALLDAEEAALESEKRHGITLMSIGDGVIVTNAEGRVTFLNTVAEALTGWSNEEAKNAPLDEVFRVVDEDTRAPVESPVRRVLQEGQVVGLAANSLLLSKDGQEYPIADSGAPIRNVADEITGAVLVFRNQTNERGAQRALKESEEKFRTVFEHMGSGSCLDDMVYENGVAVDYRILEVNPSYERITGLTREQVVGRLASQVYGTGEAPYLDLYARTAETGESYTFETYFEPLKRYFEITVSSPIKGRVSTIISDIDERRRAALALAESERRVRDKLEAVLSPEGDLGVLELGDIIDISSIQAIMNHFNELSGICMAILDNSGKILVATGWQDICTRFHRVHPLTCRNCHESDIDLSGEIPPGDYRKYRCKNNMWDIATPIHIGGRLLGKLYLGQFFYETEEPNREVFREQAKACGFDEAEYLAALDRVPRFKPETIENAMSFFIELMSLVSKLSYGHLKLARSLEDRKRAEEALKASEQRLRDITFSMADWVWEVDGNGTYSYSSLKGIEYFGYGEEDIIGKTPFDFMDEAEAERVAPLFADFVMRKAPIKDLENWNIRKNGERLCLLSNGVPILGPNGDLLGYRGVDKDITERKLAEEALRRTKDNLDLALRSANMGVWRWNIQEKQSHFDEQSCRLLGIDFKTFDHTEEGFLKALHPDDVLKVKSALRATIEEGAPYNPEYRVIWKDKSVHYICARGKFSRDEQGRPLCIDGLVWDITESKRAEEETAKLQGQLQQAMKMEAVGRLAGGVAHDFNNLLTGITGNISLALLELKADDPLTENLSEVNKAAESAAALTRQLLAFSRKQIIEPKVLNLNDILSSLHKMLVRLIGEDVELATILTPELEAVKVDPGQIEQILVNLAVNARDAMPDGGRLVIETDNVELDESYSRRHSHTKPGRYVMLAVSDTGHGMSESIKSHLFEPFFTTKPLGRGTGLGLATIYGAVKQSNGSIEVYSEEGQGTTFKIYLPRVAEKAEKLHKLNRAAEMVGGSETILLVEDEKIVRDMATRVLKRLGYVVLSAPEGGKAILLAETNRPIDLMITDVVMPGINGRQLAERLSKIHPEMKVLYTSGYTENVIVHHGVVDETLNFIGKPYSPQALAKKLREVLDGKKG